MVTVVWSLAFVRPQVQTFPLKVTVLFYRNVWILYDAGGRRQPQPRCQSQKNNVLSPLKSLRNSKCSTFYICIHIYFKWWKSDLQYSHFLSSLPSHACLHLKKNKKTTLAGWGWTSCVKHLLPIDWWILLHHKLLKFDCIALEWYIPPKELDILLSIIL